MKPALLALVFAPIVSFAQIRVESKPQTIVDVGYSLWPFKIDRIVVEDDTSYNLVFRNTEYREIVDLKSIQLDKDKLKELGEAFAKALTVDMQQEVWTGSIALTREKVTFAGICVKVYYDHAFGEVKEKRAQVLIAAIKKECPL